MQQKFVWWWLSFLCVVLLVSIGLAFWFAQSSTPQSILPEKPTPIPPQGSVMGASTVENTSVPQSTITPTPSFFITPTQLPTLSPPTPSALPTSKLTPPKTPLFGIQNADFSAGLQQWRTRGAVQVFALTQQDRNGLPPNTNHFVRLASETNFEWLGAHALEQQFVPPSDTTAIEFWYRLYTEETEPGFDSPSFVVFINQQAVAWFSAQQASETWQQIVVPNSEPNQPLTLSFIAGQTGDQTKATWVDVTQIRTSTAAPTQIAFSPFPSETRMELSFSDPTAIDVSFDSPQLSQNTLQKLNQELLIPDLGERYSLENLAWSPTGETFQPNVNAPDFSQTNGARYTTSNLERLITKLDQLKATNPEQLPKLWLTLKNALNQVVQLLPVDY